MTEPARRPAIIASAPTRLDFGGGWTDVPPFPEDRGGFVCNLAIDRRATVTLHPSTDGRGHEPPLVAAALRRAARDGPLPDALAVELQSDFPVGAGLGGSSAALVALAAAFAHLQFRALDPTALAEWSRAVEVEELGIAGGRQDHYAAAFGGALGLSFGRHTTVDRCAMSAATVHALEARGLLVYTGESRLSGTTITAVLDAYRDRVPRVLDALDRMKALAVQMRDALRAGDVDALAAHVDEHWTHQRALHPKITTDRIDALETAARRNGAIGLKALGASGGGCVLLFSAEFDMERLARAAEPFGSRLLWRVAADGVRVREVELDSTRSVDG